MIIDKKWEEYKDEIQKNKYKRNASPAQRGYNYQNFAGLYLLVRYMKELSSINIEGIEDVEIVFKDGSLGFYQAKEVDNYSKVITATVLKKALTTLLEDFAQNDHEKIKDLSIVTNSNYPLTHALAKGLFTDNANAKKIMFNELDDKAKERIKNHIPPIAENHFNFDKLSIIKLPYIGAQKEDKLTVIYNEANKLFGKSEFSEQKSQIINEWFELLLNMTGNPDESVKKDQIVSHTEVIILQDQTKQTIMQYLNTFECNIEKVRYIKSQYSKYLNGFQDIFETKNKVQTDFLEFTEKNLLRNMIKLLKTLLKLKHLEFLMT